MNEPDERIASTCPSCSPDLQTIHQIIHSGGQATIRCTECGHVHKKPLQADSEIERKVIVSQSGESFTETVEGPPEERIQVGEEFVLDTDDALVVVRITDIQVGTEQRVESAAFEQVETIWTRAVDNVSLNVTLHPKSGNETRSVEVKVPGDYEFEVGKTEELGDETFTIEGLHIREKASEYPTTKLDQTGDVAIAKDLKRVYARDESSSAWSAW